MSRRHSKRIPKGTKEKEMTHDDVLENLNRIQNRKDREKKSKDMESKSNFNMFPIIVVVIVVFGIGMLLPNIPQNNSSDESSDDTDDNSSIDTMNLIFQDLDSTKFNLIQYRGQHIILDVMGTTCDPCAQQIEILKEFTNQYPHVVVVSVSSEDIAILAKYKTQNNIDWKLFKDAYSVSTRLQVMYIPTLIHISPEYIEENRNVGVTSIETLSTWIS